MVHVSHSTPLLRLVLVLAVVLLALAAGVAATGPQSGWLFLGVAFGAAPVAAVVDGRARSRGREAPRRTRPIPAPSVTRVTSAAPV